MLKYDFITKDAGFKKIEERPSASSAGMQIEASSYKHGLSIFNSREGFRSWCSKTSVIDVKLHE